jgi:hypothetical protein
MKNIDRLTKHITQSGEKGLMVHTIPGTNNWVVCQKTEKDKWALTLCNPMGNVTFNLGTVNDGQHLLLWEQIIKMKIENSASQIKARNQIKEKVNYFIKNYEKIYKNFLKEKTKKSKIHKKFKKSIK